MTTLNFTLSLWVPNKAELNVEANFKHEVIIKRILAQQPKIIEKEFRSLPKSLKNYERRIALHAPYLLESHFQIPPVPFLEIGYLNGTCTVTLSLFIFNPANM